jgi:hypothetical protein
MAVLDNNDYTQIKRLIQSNPDAKAIFKVWGLDKQTWKDLFQAAEDWFVGAFTTTPTTSFQDALDAVATTTTAQAKWVGKVWFMWRIDIDW